MTRSDTVTRHLFLGFIKVHVLHHAAETAVYGLALIDELARHGYRISPGTLYPILHGLEAAGYLSSHREKVAGKVRRCYTITRAGRSALRDARAKIVELVREVVQGSDSAQPRARLARRA